MTWLSDFVGGNRGKSTITDTPVRPEAMSRLGKTLILALAAAALAVPIGLALAVFTTRRPGSVTDLALQMVIVAVAALPEFVVGVLLLLLIFGVVLKWLPVANAALTFGDTWAKVKTYVLPVATLTIVALPYIVLIGRTAAREALHPGGAAARPVAPSGPVGPTMDAHRWNLEPLSHDELRERGPARYPALFEPVRIGPTTAPNRFYSVPYSTGWAMHDIKQEIAHRGLRASGGWGVVTTGVTAVCPESTNEFIEELQLFDDDDVRKVAVLADAIQEHGALAGIELTHYGGLASPAHWRHPPKAVTQTQTDAMFGSSALGQAMTRADIVQAQRQWVAASLRARAAGFDFVEVHAAHASLPVQFLAPYYNRRSDEYGGSLDNRARFLLELLERIREAIGDDMAVACRFVIEALGPGGVGIDEGLEVMRKADHLVGVWDIVIGGIGNVDRDVTPSRLHARAPRWSGVAGPRRRRQSRSWARPASPTWI